MGDRVPQPGRWVSVQAVEPLGLKQMAQNTLNSAFVSSPPSVELLSRMECRVPDGTLHSPGRAEAARQGDRPQHHLIDPRRGEPAQTDWLSVTVVTPHAAAAEVFAKALLIAGSREADPVAARNQEIAWIAVDENGRLWGSRNSIELFDVEG